MIFTYRLIYSNNPDVWFMDENNWNVLLSKLTPYIKQKLMYNSEAVDYFFNDDNWVYYLFNYNNIDLTILPINYTELYLLNTISITGTVIVLFDQITNILYNYYILDLNNNLIHYNSINTVLTNVSSYFISLLFLSLIIFIFLTKFHQDYGTVNENDRTFFGILYEEFILVWTNLAGIKFESYEEALCVLVFWPWCIFLIFTHIFTVENSEIFFIFIEWGVPVIYGYLILIESMWLFGTYFFVYLSGAKGRRVLTITLFEDVVNFLILIARVTLQMVRGIICGLYHDFFREATEYLIDTWEMYWYYVSGQLPFCKNSYVTDFLLFFIDWYLFLFLLLFIYTILFLQLLFLIIAVWLFCRCWFISSKHIYNEFKFYKQLSFNIRESNLNQNNKFNLA